MIGKIQLSSPEGMLLRSRRSPNACLEDPRLEALRRKINDEKYLHAAIQRFAEILSNELISLPQGGSFYGRR